MTHEMRIAADHGADLVELRLDCLATFNPRPHLPFLLKHRPLPFIVTSRVQPLMHNQKSVPEFSGDECRLLCPVDTSMM
ncbi:hypothetical protein J5N97_001727 [Dioscorea zingiberensis]|uniref:Type I 3-dehydroquinate dehydratase n=1 Tax=Dioscorea zingiberensis TaxID=325984 RepID=A0A9D5BTR0_9LILI|nr:hypothetical protein J5N97_001727 [Dioscorea zingiberensis]